MWPAYGSLRHGRLAKHRTKAPRRRPLGLAHIGPERALTQDSDALEHTHFKYHHNEFIMSTFSTILVALAASTSVVGILLMPRNSERYGLGVALCLSLPFVGSILAQIATRTKGTGQVLLDLSEDRYEVKERLDSREEILSDAWQPPLLDRLLSRDADARLGAQVQVSDQADSESVNLLRWVIKYGDSDAVLDAALTLEELELRWTERLDEARQMNEEEASAENALAVARSCWQGIETGLAESALVPKLVKEARARYAEVALLDRSMRPVIGHERVELELAAGSAVDAANVLDELVERGLASKELKALQYRVRFASRQAVRSKGQTYAAPKRDVQAGSAN